MFYLARSKIKLRSSIISNGFPGGSMVKNSPAKQETWVRSLGRKDPLKNEMSTHSSILAWETPWREEPGGLQTMGSQRVGHDLATKQQQIISNTKMGKKYKNWATYSITKYVGKQVLLHTAIGETKWRETLMKGNLEILSKTAQKLGENICKLLGFPGIHSDGKESASNAGDTS